MIYRFTHVLEDKFTQGVDFNYIGTTKNYQNTNWLSGEKPSLEDFNLWILEYNVAEAKKLLRIKRNQLLQESDWRDLPSYPGTDQAEWRTYRQALRDLTNTETPALNDNGELINVNWPVPPGESNGS